MTKPTVLALAGRRIDAPGAAEPRFPAAQVPAVRERLRELLASTGATALVCSAACGADLLALEVAGEAQLRRRVILPFDMARFRTTSVVDRGREWGDVFDRVMRALPAIDRVVLNLRESDDAYTRTNVEILDHAQQLAGAAGPVHAVIVWNGVPRGADDITLQFAETARARGLPVTEILTIAPGSA